MGVIGLSKAGSGLRRAGWALLLLAAARLDPGVAVASEFPYELETGREVALTGSAVVLLGAAHLADRNTPAFTESDLSQLDPNRIPGLERGISRNWNPVAAKTSDWLLLSMTVAPLGLLATDGGSKQPWTVGTMYLQTQLLNGGATALLKNLVRRTRPFAYNPDAPLEARLGKDARRSFPSGHSSTTFAAATFLGVVHERLHPGSSANPWVWGVSYAAATTTAVLRVVAGKHFPTDVAAGAALGILTGWLVPTVHELDPAGETESGFAPIPVVSFTF